MMFFKQIRDEKLKDQVFARNFRKECHICATTINVIAQLEDPNTDLEGILKKTGIDPEEYDALKQGDLCNPEQVLKLCCCLNIPTDGFSKKCPRHRRKRDLP